MANPNTAQSEGLTLTVDSSVSLQALVDQSEAGFPVRRTPHIGNFSDGNLTTVALGLPHMICDRMLTGRDTIYHPAEIIHNGVAERIAPKIGTLSVTHTVVETLPTQAPLPVSLGEALTEVHTRALRAVFPDSQLETQTNYVLRHSDTIQQVVRAIAPEVIGDFQRYIEPNGHVRRAFPAEVEAKLAIGDYFQNGDDAQAEEGLLLPNRVAILLDAVIEALEYQTDTVYELCGQTMSSYIKKKEYQELDKLYQLVRSQTDFGDKLPARLNIVFVPTVDARFVVPAALQQPMDALLDSFLAHKAADQARGQRRGQLLADIDGPDRAEAAKQLGSADKPVSNAERAEIGQLAQQVDRIFADTDSGQQITQYDLLAEGYYLAPQLLNFSMEAVKQAFKEISRYRDQELAK